MPRLKQFDEQEILTRAMKLFWKQGYHATSMDNLVKFLGISRASLYGTFGGKKDLFNKAFEHYRTTNSNSIQCFLGKQTQVKKGLRDLFYHLIEESFTDQDCKGCFIVNTTTELLPGDDKIQNTLRKNQEAFQQTFHSFLLKGTQTGEISNDQDLKSVASLLFTFFNGLRVVSKFSDNPQELKKSIDLILLLLE